MTVGHKHRTLKIKREGFLYRSLTKVLARTADPERAEKSRWVWGPGEPERIEGDGPVRFAQVYELRVLGVLHSLTGLTLEVKEP